LGCGIVTLLALQAAVNIGVTTSLLPNKGLPLPFISYGGSNLAACLFGVGILLSIYRQAKLEPGNTKRITMQAQMTPRICTISDFRLRIADWVVDRAHLRLRCPQQRGLHQPSTRNHQPCHERRYRMWRNWWASFS